MARSRRVLKAERQRAERGHPKPFKTKGGRWVVRFTYPKDPSTGRPSRPPRSLYGATSDEAQAKWDKLAVEVATATWRPESDTLVREVVAAWLKAKAPDAPYDLDRTVRQSTHERDYEPKLRLHVLPYLGHRPIGEIDGPTLKAWLRAITPTTSTTMRGRCLVLVRQIVRWAVGEGIIGADPTVGVSGPKVVKRPRPVETAHEDLGDIIKAIESHYLRSFYEIALMLGPRSGELRGLLASNVDDAQRTIHLHYTLDWARAGRPVLENTKSDASHRSIRLPDTLWDHLVEYRSERERQRALRLEAGHDWPDTVMVWRPQDGAWIEVDPVFRRLNGSALREDGKGGAGDLFKRALVRSGFPPRRLHELRHLAVGLLLEVAEPWEVAQIVGHSSYHLTLDIYAPRARVLLERTATDLEPIYQHLVEVGYTREGVKVSDKVSEEPQTTS